MSHFAQVENGIVINVLVIEQEVIDTGLFGDPSSWVQTSYNTSGNVHYGQDGLPDGGVALRANYAGVGFTYDADNDVFYPPKPEYASWTLNHETWTWEAPVPMPVDETGEKVYYWDEESLSWREYV
jgi:hypothetical protein